MRNKGLFNTIRPNIPKVYKNKKLNNANFGDFCLSDYQVFLHLVSKIGGVDKYGKYLQIEQLEREYDLTAQEFSKIFNTDFSNSYKLLHKTCKKLMRTSITLEKIELGETWEINICSTAKYNKNEGCISIKFTDDIMSYLAQVKQKFILYNLKEIANFGSLYTTRLYELIQQFKETGWMLKSVEQLREIFAVGNNKFRLYGHFKVRTFGHACQEINDNYDINLSFEEIKESRKVVAVKFLFKKTNVIKTMDQAGNTHNVYAPPKPKKLVPKPKSIKSNKPLNKPLNSELEDQLSFDALAFEEPKSKNPFWSLIAKLKPTKN